MVKSRLIFLFNSHLTVAVLQLSLFFVNSSIKLSLGANILTFVLSVFTIVSLGRMFACSLFSFPHMWFLISFTYLFVVVPIFHLSNPSYTSNLFPGFDWESNYWKVLLISGLFMNVFFAISLSYFFRKLNYELIFQPPTIEIRRFTLFLVFIYSVVGFAIWIDKVGGVSSLFLTRSSFTQSGLQFRNGYLYASLNFGFGAILVLLLKGFFLENRKRIVTSLIFTTCFMLPDLIRGTRVNGLFAFVCCICAYSIYRKWVGNSSLFSKLQWIYLAILFPLFVIAPRLYRVQSSFSMDYIRQAFDVKNWFDSFAGYDSAMDIGLSIFLKAGLDTGFGSSYLQAFLRPIPRIFWPDKPRELDVYFNQAIFPETSSHVGISFSGFSEPIYNFGIFGILIFALLLGGISSFSFLRSMQGDIHYILVTVFISAFSYNLLRGNLSTSYPQLVFPLFASFIILKRRII